MADQQTDNRQPAGKPKLSRGVFLVLCLVIVALFVTLWMNLASKDIEVEIAVKQPATEQSVITGESKAADKGKWYVSLASFRLEKEAAAMVNRISQKGVKADYISFIGKRKDYQWYRVQVSGFASEQAAQDELVVLAKKLGIRNAWVGEKF
jgi:cell division septation protein DedD